MNYCKCRHPQMYHPATGSPRCVGFTNEGTERCKCTGYRPAVPPAPEDDDR